MLVGTIYGKKMKEQDGELSVRITSSGGGGGRGKDVPDTKHTRQDNVSCARVVRLTALTAASEQLWKTLDCLTMSCYVLFGWSFITPLCTVSHD